VNKGLFPSTAFGVEIGCGFYHHPGARERITFQEDEMKLKKLKDPCKQWEPVNPADCENVEVYRRLGITPGFSHCFVTVEQMKAYAKQEAEGQDLPYAASVDVNGEED
jgi:hypothetical protein